MTDRELHTPTAAPLARSLAPAAAPPNSTPQDPAHEGNGSLMLATIATRPPQRNTPATEPGERGRVWLDCLFAGDFTFPAIPTIAIPPGDRTPAEHDAVTRALGCRDLFVIHADPAAGERVMVDLARSTAERVLILTPNPAAADRLTDRFLKCGVAVLRALADDENPTRPSPSVSKATSFALGNARVDQTRKEAAAALVAAEQRIAAFAVVSKAIARLIEVSELLKKLDVDIVELTARRDRIEAVVRAEVDSPFANMLAKLTAEHDNVTARLTAELQTFTASRKETETTLATARHQHAESLRKPGFFARFFSGKGKPDTPDSTELEKRVHTLEAEVATLNAQIAELQAKVEEASNAFTAEREKLFAGEVTTRRNEIVVALSAAETDRARVQTEAAALKKVIGDAVPGEDHVAAERQLAAAHQKAAEVAASTPELIARAVAEPRVVVGIPKSLDADPVFGALGDDPPFGLLVLDRAEELPEAEFPRLARLAECWVLVGNAIPHDDPRPTNGRAGRNSRVIEVPFVTRLAKLLDRETWTMEGDRLICRLAPLTPDQRRTVMREPLADRPEIELRFIPSDDDQRLAEIAFPASISVPTAKRFLFHTLSEVLLRPCGEVCWTHAPDMLIATWPSADTGRDGEWIELHPGVREKVAGLGLFAFTAAVSFDPVAGWDAEKAEAWLANYLPPPVTGRFAALPRSTGPRHVG